MIENAYLRAARRAPGAQVPVTPQERFVTRVYASLDGAIARGLERLRREDGVVPACARGCPHCCWNHIVVNAAETHALAQYIRREFSAGRLRRLRARTRRWHDWNDRGPGRRPPGAAVGPPADPLPDGQRCPLLVRGACSAYPARPIVCRTHYIRSHPRFCRAANDPGAAGPPPVAITSILRETRRYPAALRGHIEGGGRDFSRSMMLLPHWLAIQMGWDFAVTS